MADEVMYIRNYKQDPGNVSESLVKAVSVTPSDSAEFLPTKGLYVGGAGNVSVVMSDDSSVTFSGLAVGTIHNISVKSVKATGTTATSILALY